MYSDFNISITVLLDVAINFQYENALRGFLSLFLILYFKALFPGFLRSRELEVYLKIVIYFPLSLFLMP